MGREKSCRRSIVNTVVSTLTVTIYSVADHSAASAKFPFPHLHELPPSPISSDGMVDSLDLSVIID